jgi:hypothetical protein
MNGPAVIAPPSPELLQDLALVLPDPQPYENKPISAVIKGQSASIHAALDHAAALLQNSRAPAIANVQALSLEALSLAVALAEAARARLLPSHAAPAVSPAAFGATLGHALSCDLALWVGPCDNAPQPLLKRLRDRIAHHVTLTSNLDELQALRLELTASPDASATRAPGASPALPLLQTLLHARRALFLLPADADARLVAQCDSLAASLQNRVRLAVMTLPDAKHSLNRRGALELITWQTGLSCASGGIDFSDSAPRPSPPLQTLLDRHAIDLLIDCAPGSKLNTDRLSNTSRTPARITLGPSDPSRTDPAAEVSFITPGLTLGLAARVMRYDGIVLWLCDDPASAPADPVVGLLKDLLQRVQPQPLNTP